MEEFSLAELANQIKYRNTPDGCEAVLWEHVIGNHDRTLTANHDRTLTAKAVESWKFKVLKSVAHLSTTVVLRTACNCEQMIDGVSRRAMSHIVPLIKTQTAVQISGLEFPEKSDYQRREFRNRGEIDSKSGCRLFAERCT